MLGVVNKFFIASMLMWAVPLGILYGFNHNLFPGELFFLQLCVTITFYLPLV